MDTYRIVIVAIAFSSCIYVAICFFLARRNLPKGSYYLPFANESEIPPRAKLWRNRAYIGVATFIFAAALLIVFRN